MSTRRIVEISAIVLDNAGETVASISEYSYEWEWRTQTSLPPPQKTFGSNNGAWAGAKSLYASTVNYAAQDVSSIVRQMRPNDTIKIENKADSSIWSKGILAVTPVEYSGFFTFPISSGDGVGVPVNNQVYKVTLTTGAAQPAPGAIVFCLLEDGSLAKYNNFKATWTYMTMPSDQCKGYARIISTTLMPNGYELIHNVESGMWAWRKAGSTIVPPPSIEGEVSAVFDNKDDTINDAKQRFVVKGMQASQILYDEMEEAKT